MDKIPLITHDGTNNYLQHIEGDKYKLVTPINFIRGGQVSDGKEFVDPSGGPMLVVGNKIAGTDYVIESIGFEKGVGSVIVLK